MNSVIENKKNFLVKVFLDNFNYDLYYCDSILEVLDIVKDYPKEYSDGCIFLKIIIVNFDGGGDYEKSK